MYRYLEEFTVYIFVLFELYVNSNKTNTTNTKQTNQDQKNTYLRKNTRGSLYKSSS